MPNRKTNHICESVWFMDNLLNEISTTSQTLSFFNYSVIFWEISIWRTLLCGTIVVPYWEVSVYYRSLNEKRKLKKKKKKMESGKTKGNEKKSAGKK